MAFVFCLASFAFVFAVAVPLILKLIHKISGTKISLNFPFLLIIFFVTFFVSLWLYAQLVLVISGDTEQVKYNLSSLFPALITPQGYWNYIKLSLEYDTLGFIISILRISFFLVLLIFIYLKVIIKNKNDRWKAMEFLFVMCFLIIYCTVPFSVIENHKQAIENKRLEQEKVIKAQEEARISTIRNNLLPIYNRVGNVSKTETLFTLPTQKSCSDNISSREYGEISCGETGFLCANISVMEKDPKDIAYDCRKNGW
jgi:hypothetical protein